MIDKFLSSLNYVNLSEKILICTPSVILQQNIKFYLTSTNWSNYNKLKGVKNEKIY